MSQPPHENSYDQFVELYTKHEKSLGCFVRSLVPTWHDADEIVQEVAITAWKKFGDFEIGTSFIAWVCTIARFKTLSYRRKMALDKLAFRSDLLELMADEGNEEDELRHREMEALEKCLTKLPEKQRRWVKLAYTPGVSAKEEAEALGMRPNTFYMRLNRIRAVLHDCIEGALAEGGAR